MDYIELASITHGSVNYRVIRIITHPYNECCVKFHWVIKIMESLLIFMLLSGIFFSEELNTVLVMPLLHRNLAKLIDCF